MTEEKKNELVAKQPDLLTAMASSNLLERNYFWKMIRSSIVPKEFTDDQTMTFLAVSHQLGLNPLNREVHPMLHKGKVLPLVGVDGWLRRANDHPAFDGLEVEMNDAKTECTCRVFRKDRSKPVQITEYLEEVRKNTGPWKDSPSRMLRHRAIIQAIRIAFGSGGAVDEDDRSVLKTTYEEIGDKAESVIGDLNKAMDKVASETQSATPPMAETEIEDAVFEDSEGAQPEQGGLFGEAFTPCGSKGCGSEGTETCQECGVMMCKEHFGRNGYCKICEVG